MMDASFKKNELVADIFKVAPYMVNYLESFLSIERHLSCKFDLTIGNVFADNHRTALILASSLEDKWYRVKTDFDGEFRCDYDYIPDHIADDPEPKGEIVVAGKVLHITLQRLHFLQTNILLSARVQNETTYHLLS